MDSKELRLFREAYGSVYSTQKEETVAEEQVDEGAGIVTGAAKAINAVMKPVGQTPEQGEKAVSNLTKAMDKVAKPIKTGIKTVLSTGGKAITAGGGTPDTQRIDNEARRLGRDAMRRSGKYEDADLFDIVKGHLMSEGYADTEEAALAIMANMSEEWRQSILLELTPLGVKTAGVVDDQRRGSNMAQDMQSIQNTLKKLKPKGPVVTPGGLPGV